MDVKAELEECAHACEQLAARAEENAHRVRGVLAGGCVEDYAAQAGKEAELLRRCAAQLREEARAM